MLKLGLYGSPMWLGLLAVSSFAAEPSIPDSVEWKTGIEYSNPDNTHLQLNLAQPRKGDGPFPTVLCIHGGGFRAGKRESYDALCIKLAARGYVAATITYRLAPQHKFPAAVHDTKAAVRWLRANAKTYKINPDKLHPIGRMGGPVYTRTTDRFELIRPNTGENK